VNAAEWALATLRYSDADTVPVPRRVLEELASASGSEPASLADHGSGPGGDFTANDLRARYRRSASWVRERLAAGDFGKVYQLGRDRLATREGVLLFDERKRGTAAEPVLEIARKGTRMASLVERRARRGVA
jgi:hypothetical protein